MVRVALVCLLVAGCLRTPGPAEGDDAGPIDAAVGCNPVSQFTAQAFPPALFQTRHAVVGDVNGDGVDDLVIVSNAMDAEAIHVLLGPIDPAAPRYHAAIPTALEVGQVELRQVDQATACPELSVFGRTRGGTPVGMVKVWRYDGDGAMYESEPAARQINFVPDVTNAPTMIAWARVHAGADDILVADLDDMRVVHVHQGLDGLDTAAVATVFHDEAGTIVNWNNINGIAARPLADDSRDRVLVVENGEAHLLVDDVGDGTGTLGGGPAVLYGSTALGTASVDLDDTPPDDVLVGGTQFFGAYLLAESGGEVAVTEVEGPSGYDPLGTSGRLDGFAVGDLGGGPAPEFVALDGSGDDAPVPAVAILVDSLAAGASLTGGTAQAFDFSGGFSPRDVVLGDLLDSGARQAWIVGDDGTLVCLQRDSAIAALQLCD